MSDYHYLRVIVYGSNAISTIFSALTVYLYFWLPNVQDIHGTCIFHYSFNTAILHAIGLYYTIAESSILPETTCFMELDVIIFVLTAINTWSIILSYNTWKQSPQPGLVTDVNPRRRLNYYRFIGYGVPFIYQLVIMSLHLSVPKSRSIRYDEFDGCLAIFLRSLVIPFATSTIMNVFYFVDTQRRLGNLLARIAASQNDSPEDKIILKRLTYKFRLNLKLCTTMNIPFVISLILAQVVRNELMRILPFILATLHGTFIFLVAVAFRKRVIKGFVKHGDKLCVGCIPSAIHQDVLRADDVGDETDCDEASCAEEGRATAAPQTSPIKRRGNIDHLDSTS